MERVANVERGRVESVGVGARIWNLICRIGTGHARGVVGAEVKLPAAVRFGNFDCTAVWDDGPRSAVGDLEGRPAVGRRQGGRPAVGVIRHGTGQADNVRDGGQVAVLVIGK